MGLFGRNDSDNYRAVWHDLNARINGYKLHMPYKWETLSDSYIMYNKDGVTHVIALIKSSDSEKCIKELKLAPEITHIRITLIDHVGDTKYLIEKAIAVEIDRAKNNIAWDIYPHMTADVFGRANRW